jgi:8-oxo-dGTP pyrophosphatase MutT (NUDIX family)
MQFDDVAALKQMLATFDKNTNDPIALAQSKIIGEFIAQTDTPWRQTPSHPRGHITASAWVLDHALTHAALLHHKKLNCWLQPGGHVEEGDSSWFDASKRELQEETGLADLTLTSDFGDALFDVDVHPIPARVATATRATEPAHHHFDVRFLFVAQSAATLRVNIDESEALRWFAIDELIVDEAIDASVRRMALLSKRLSLNRNLPRPDVEQRNGHD